MLLLLLTFLDALRPTPEDRALAYLAREVPAWSLDNKCYSCHNNGDAARALYAAHRLGHKLPEKALADTTRWIADPVRWDDNGGDPKFSDKRLARLQFALTLLEAGEAGLVKDPNPLRDAAALVAAGQHTDGSWPVGADGALGSPATHGTTLATAEASRLLRRADARKYEQSLTKADAWLRHKQVKTVLDAAAVLLALEKADDAAAAAQRKECLALVRKGESREGGWGPYVNSAPEVFDTALVVLALAREPPTDEVRAWQKRGRAYLIAAQREDGSWPETTRPSGADSYAQRLSTTGWATQALLATRTDP
jgi:hypothetical protein